MTSTVTNSQVNDVSRMGSSMRGQIIPIKNGKAVSLDLRLADRWGCQPTTAHSRRYLLPTQVVDVIEELRIARDADGLASFTAPLIAALAEVPGDCVTAQREYDAADAGEDLGQIAWIYEKSSESLDLYIKKLASEIIAAEKLLASLQAERQRRKDAK